MQETKIPASKNRYGYSGRMSVRLIAAWICCSSGRSGVTSGDIASLCFATGTDYKIEPELLANKYLLRHRAISPAGVEFRKACVQLRLRNSLQLHIAMVTREDLLAFIIKVSFRGNANNGKCRRDTI